MERNGSQVIIITHSRSLARILPEIVESGTGRRARVCKTPAGALELGRAGRAVWIVDLATVRHMTRELGALYDRTDSPPTVFLGEPWDIPRWLRGRFGPDRVFSPHPLDPERLMTGLNRVGSTASGSPGAEDGWSWPDDSDPGRAAEGPGGADG